MASGKLMFCRGGQRHLIDTNCIERHKSLRNRIKQSSTCYNMYNAESGNMRIPYGLIGYRGFHLIARSPNIVPQGFSAKFKRPFEHPRDPVSLETSLSTPESFSVALRCPRRCRHSDLRLRSQIAGWECPEFDLRCR